MNGKYIGLLTTIVAIGLTILLYNCAVTEWTNTLIISLIIVCFSEVALMCTLGLTPSINYKNGTTGIILQIFAVLLILWSLIGANLEGNNFFFIGLLVICIIMVLLIGLASFGSQASDASNEKTEHSIDRKKNIVSTPQLNAVRDKSFNLTSAWLTIQGLIDDDDIRKQIRILIERIQSLPASLFPNPIIERGMTEIVAMCRALSNSDAKERIKVRLQSKITEITNYIKAL